jgi:hypothetical protein
MNKENKHKIKSSAHITSNDNTGTFNKRYHTIRLSIATIVVVIIYAIGVAPTDANKAALGLSIDSTATDTIGSVPMSSAADTKTTLLTSGDLTIAVTLHDHTYTIFSQAVKVYMTSKDGAEIGDYAYSNVSPFKSKTVYLTIPADKVTSNKLFSICITNQNWGKTECTEEVMNNNPQDANGGNIMQVSLVVP